MASASLSKTPAPSPTTSDVDGFSPIVDGVSVADDGVSVVTDEFKAATEASDAGGHGWGHVFGRRLRPPKWRMQAAAGEQALLKDAGADTMAQDAMELDGWLRQPKVAATWGGATHSGHGTGCHVHGRCPQPHRGCHHEGWCNPHRAWHGMP